MKLIRSVVRPSKLDDLKRALSSVNVTAFTVTEIHDYAPENTRSSKTTTSTRSSR